MQKKIEIIIMAKRQIWQIPSLNYQEEQGEHRKVTWLELFFDLFFVVSISQIAHGLGGHFSWNSLVDFTIFFIPTWWIWIGFTYYNERFESDGLENRIITFLLMMPVIGLAVFARHHDDGNFPYFLLSYAAARIIITALWLRATLHVEAFRQTGFKYVIGFSISAAITLISAFISLKNSYWLFGFALVIDLLTPLTTLQHQAKLPRFSTSKLPERFGLFVIIVLGEMVVGVVNGLAEAHHINHQIFLKASLGIAIGFAFWWVYFDFIARRPPKVGIVWSFAWGYLHLPLVMAFAAAGAGISFVIGKETRLTAEAKQLISSAVACALITMSFLEMTLHREKDEPSHEHFSPLFKFLAGLGAFAVGWTEIVNDSFSLFLTLFLLIMSQIIYGVWAWFRQHLPEKE